MRQTQSRDVMGSATDKQKSRLLRHDRMIVANELRSALSSWSDRLIALAALVFVLVAVRFALADRSFIFASTAIAGLATAVGAGVARMIARRMDYHAQDGVLAADALADHSLRQYALPIHALVVTIVTACAAIGRPTAAAYAPIGYLVSALICHIAYAVVDREASPRSSLSLRSIRRELHRPIAGVAAAVPTILLMLLMRSVQIQQLVTVIAIVAGATALVLTMLDYHVIRFMTERGYTAGRIFGLHARPVTTFLLLTAITASILSNMFLVLVVFGIVPLALLIMATRILAYRVYAKRTADTVLTICGIACVSTLAVPVLLPGMIIAILWQLHRQSARVTSLLP